MFPEESAGHERFEKVSSSLHQECSSAWVLFCPLSCGKEVSAFPSHMT